MTQHPEPSSAEANDGLVSVWVSAERERAACWMRPVTGLSKGRLQTQVDTHRYACTHTHARTHARPRTPLFQPCSLLMCRSHLTDR